jgi:hypothetical protein
MLIDLRRNCGIPRDGGKILFEAGNKNTDKDHFK